METLLQQLLEGQNRIIEEQKITNTRLGSIEGRFDNIEGNLAENTKFIHALSQDVARTATKEDIQSLSASIEALNTRLFKQESELILLKTAK